MTIKDLIADKKKVDEELQGWKRSITSYRRCNECEDFIPQTEINRCVELSEALIKGISVATKLIEDEIKFLEESFTIYDMYCSQCMQIKMFVENRIKYLKSLLEQ